MAYTLPSGYLSVSQIRAYQRCPRQYEYEYVRRVESPSSPSLVVGRAFHRAMEVAFRRMLEDGDVMSVADVQDAFDKAWHGELESETARTVEWNGEDPGTVKDYGTTLAGGYYEQRGQHIRPRFIETMWLMDLAGVPMKGVIDLIDQDHWIRDMKTGKRSPDADTAHNSIQLTAYALACEHITDQAPAGVALEYVTPLKAGPKVTVLESQVTPRRVERLLMQVQGVAQAISSGVFYPIEESMACSWCSFRQQCKGKPPVQNQ